MFQGEDRIGGTSTAKYYSDTIALPFFYKLLSQNEENIITRNKEIRKQYETKKDKGNYDKPLIQNELNLKIQDRPNSENTNLLPNSTSTSNCDFILERVLNTATSLPCISKDQRDNDFIIENDSTSNCDSILEGVLNTGTSLPCISKKQKDDDFIIGNDSTSNSDSILEGMLNTGTSLPHISKDQKNNDFIIENESTSNCDFILEGVLNTATSLPCISKDQKDNDFIIENDSTSNCDSILELVHQCQTPHFQLQNIKVQIKTMILYN